jgi:hypothetical protein
VVVEGIALERQQHELVPSRVLGGRDVEDDGHRGPDVLDADSLSVYVADGGSLKRANCGGRLPWCCHWCCSGSRTRWRCNGSEDGCDSSRLLGLGDARLKGCKGSNEVGWSSGKSRGGGGHACHDSLLLLWHGLDGSSVLIGGGGRSLDGGEGCGQVEQSDARGS